MSQDAPTIFLCYDPPDRVCADKFADWPRTNALAAAYDARVETLFDRPAAEPLRAALRAQIRAADVTVCLIGEDTWRSPWIDWELRMSKESPRRNGLVGVVLQTYHPRPAAIENSGAIFVPFKRDAVARAIRWAATESYTQDDFTLVDE